MLCIILDYFTIGSIMDIYFWHPGIRPLPSSPCHTHTLLVFKTLFPHSSHVVWEWLTSSRVECDSGSNGSSHPLPSMMHSVMAKYQPEMMLGLLEVLGHTVLS